MNYNSLDQWLRYLETLHPSEIELGLDRTRLVANSLLSDAADSSEGEVLELKPFVITVAGTNGKGTTIAALETILLKHGFTVGTYTSPHLIKFNERICINGEMVSDEAICNSFDVVENVRGDTSLTYFEFATLSALWLFQQSPLDVVLLEVGLGGRLDAVNVIEPNVSVLTSLGLDHTDWLGSTIDSIAVEKTGIARVGRPFICGASNLPKSIKQDLERIAAPLICSSQFGYVQSGKGESHSEGTCWQGVKNEGSNEGSDCAVIKKAINNITISDIPSLHIPSMNMSLALQVLQFLPFRFSDQLIVEAISEVRLTGRLQVISRGEPCVMVDVAHNEQAATYLATQLAAERHNYTKIIAIYSALEDKDSDTVVGVLSEVIDEWVIVPLDVPRATSLAKLQSSLKINKVKMGSSLKSVSEALKTLSKNNSQNTLIIVFGSFYTVSEALQFYEASSEEALNIG